MSPHPRRLLGMNDYSSSVSTLLTLGKPGKRRPQKKTCSLMLLMVLLKDKGGALLVTQGPVLQRDPCSWFLALQSPS